MFVYNVSVETVCMYCSFVVSQFVHVGVDMLVNTCDVFPLPENVCCLFISYFNAAAGKVKKKRIKKETSYLKRSLDLSGPSVN